MFDYTFGNHFQIGYRNRTTLKTRWFKDRLGAEEEFVARYGRATQRLPSWREANTLAANRILDLALQNSHVPALCYSGGLDSEVALLSFLEALRSRPFDCRPGIEVVTLDFENGLNAHDTDYVNLFRDDAAKRFSDVFSLVTFRRERLDIVEFLQSSELLERADADGVLIPAVLCQLWLCDRIRRLNTNSDRPLLPILAQGELHLVRDEDPNGQYAPAAWSAVETENLCGIFRHFIARGEPAIPGFFQYLPEQFESQLRSNEVVHELLSHSRFGKLGTRTSKAEIIAREYPELKVRPKYTGFEKVEDLYDERRAFLSRRHPVRESKWKKNVFDLMDDLRVSKPEIAKHGDWSFAWGRGDGQVSDTRTSDDDIFASGWNSNLSPSSGSSLTSVRAKFIEAVQNILKDQTSDAVLLHDGGPMARVCAALLGKSAVGSFVRPSEVSSIAEADVVRIVLSSRVYRPDNLALVLMLQSRRFSKAPVLIPRFHHRIVNAEFDRELDTTIARPRFVWTEGESLAVLASACQAEPSARLPFLDIRLRDLVLQATEAMGWFDLDEPGPANGTPIQNFFEQVLAEIGETKELRELAASYAREFGHLLEQAQAALAKCAAPRAQDQTSTCEIGPRLNMGFSPNFPDEGPSVTAPWTNIFAAHDRLRIVSNVRWLEQARVRTPGIRLGSNLFFQQKVCGFDRLRADVHASLALVGKPGTPEAREEVAWVHLTVLSFPPNGRLRLRGVTTRDDLSRRGYATEILRLVVARLKEQRPKGYVSIDVYAAPEICKAFREAGFIDDVSRVTRAEEGMDRETGRLVATDRELTPLTFSLEPISGES